MIALDPDNLSLRAAADQTQRSGRTGTGIHAIIELYDCPEALLNDEAYVRKAIELTAAAARANLLELNSHRFAPHGVTAVGLLAESHIAIHTWPDRGYAAADLFTCGRQTLTEAATDELVRLFKAGWHSADYFTRGAFAGQAVHTEPVQNKR